MLEVHSKTFNPEVLYVFNNTNKVPVSGKKHSHDFLELTILLSGETFFVVEDETKKLDKQSVVVINPRVEHMEYTESEMENSLIHIGLRHFNFPGFKKDFLPLDSAFICLENYEEVFFETCEEIIRERTEAKPGYELILKSLVFKLIVYLLRDSNTSLSENQLLIPEKEKQEFVNEVQLYIENHYDEDLTLEQIAHNFFTSPPTLMRSFKEFVGDTPINYLINYRLEKAKNTIQTNPFLSIKEVSKSVGYEDSLYFSKLFKKHYGESPSFFAEHVLSSDDF